MNRIRPRQILTLGAVVLAAIVIEGVFLPDAPFSVVHVMYLPALYARRNGAAYMVGLGILEWGFGRIPLPAVASMIAVVLFIYELLRDDVNFDSPWVVLTILPLIELARHFWTALFASMYAVPPPPEFPFAHMVIEAFVGGLVMYGLKSRRRTPDHAASATIW